MNKKRVGAIIAGGGRGERMPGSVPKQFMLLAGKPIFIHSLEKFQACPEVDDIILVLPQDYIEQTKRILAKFPCSKLSKVVEGGIKRQDSVYNGLVAIDANLYDILIVHDAVRPLVKPSVISNVIEVAKDSGAAITAIPPVDTIKETSSNGQVTLTLDRSKLVMVQTPQAFKTEVLQQAFQEAKKTDYYGTDEASLVERLGLPVYIVDGSPSNIKITTEIDLKLAEILIKEEL